MKPGATLMMEKTKLGLKKIRLAMVELLGDQQGLAILSKLSMLKGRFNLIAGHLERGNALSCCMQVAKMAGSLVSIVYIEIVNMSIH